MKPYFEDDGAWYAYYEELMSWVGTPYRHLKMTKGRGADCTLFIGSTWLAVGILTKIEFDYYPRDFYYHCKGELVLDSLHRHFNQYSGEGFCIKKIEIKKDFMRGDALTFATATDITNHAAVWLPYNPVTNERNKMINSINDRGVCELQYGSWWADRLTSVFRIMRK